MCVTQWFGVWALESDYLGLNPESISFCDLGQIASS